MMSQNKDVSDECVAAERSAERSVREDRQCLSAKLCTETLLFVRYKGMPASQTSLFSVTLWPCILHDITKIPNPNKR